MRPWFGCEGEEGPGSHPSRYREGQGVNREAHGGGDKVQEQGWEEGCHHLGTEEALDPVVPG